MTKETKDRIEMVCRAIYAGIMIAFWLVLYVFMFLTFWGLTAYEV